MHAQVRKTSLSTRLGRSLGVFLMLLLIASGALAQRDGKRTRVEPKAPKVLHDSREAHLADVRQLTFGGENAEAYWSPDGQHLVYQATVPPYECDQIFTMRADGEGEPKLVSTGKGRTTCGYFSADGERIVYSSTHLASPECPPKPSFAFGYVWPIYKSYEIFSVKPDGSDLKQLTDNEFYDAEATVCPIDGSIIFTSSRSADLDLYRMDADGSNVRRLTDEIGYDGGAFFSPDCSKIVWRASRPQTTTEIEDFQRLVEEEKVRPGELEIWVANADGSDPRQITYMGAGSFAPFFHPNGERILFSSNYRDPRGREFDIWAVNIDGTNLERITYTALFDGFPMFSPDGTQLAFASNRNQGKEGETDVYVARWVEKGPNHRPGPAERIKDSVKWLADDARMGRGIGTYELEETRDWLAEQFQRIGAEPAGTDGYFHAFEVPVQITIGKNTQLSIGGKKLSSDDFVPASFASSGTVEGKVVPVGFGITAPELEHDDYADLDVEGKIVAVRRFVPSKESFDEGEMERRYGDLRYKAWNAREHGAIGVILVDDPDEGDDDGEAPLPVVRIETGGEAGLPVAVVSRAHAPTLMSGKAKVSLTVDLEVEKRAAHNVVAKIAPPASGVDASGRDVKISRIPGQVVIGAHYDHLGMGGSGSLTPDVTAPHNGADDNASGVAALLEIGRQLVDRRSELRRDVLLVAFSGEESGLRGSTAFTREPPPGVVTEDLLAMINLDMIGRMRFNQVSALGSDSATEWRTLVRDSCERANIFCELGGDGYGPSDQTPFYAAGIPVLHFFTGTHGDYHKPSDDAGKLNFIGTARIASAVSDLAGVLATTPESLSYQEVEPPQPRGDSRSAGASLGTIPDYTREDLKGVLLAGVRPGSAAETAGFRKGDLLVKLDNHIIRNIHDFVYVLRKAKPGDAVVAEIVRDGNKGTLDVIYDESRGIR